MKIIFSPQYIKYNFGKNHPFWPERAKQFVELLQSKSNRYKIVDAPKATDKDILLVHTKEYLERVKELAKEGGYLSVDTKVTKENLEAAYYYVGGTIAACKLALRGQLAVNLLGGLHHAGINDSSGFCIFNDHGIAIRKLQGWDPSTRSEQIKTACVLDLDVHAGNGTQEIFYSDPCVLTISIHQDPTFFYPGTGFPWQKGDGKGEGFNVNITLPPGTEEKEYLQALDKALIRIADFKPDLLIIILGVDTYKDDPLASFRLEKETYSKMAERLKNLRIKELKKTGQAILFAGGYSKDVPKLWLEFKEGLG